MESKKFKLIEEDNRHILDHTKTVWPNIAGKSIFLTGGTGFFGKWLLESFLHANDTLALNSKIIVLSRNPELFLQQNLRFKHTCAEFIKGDVRTFAFPEQPIDYIIHAATEASVSLNIEQPLLMYDTIVEGTRHVLEMARIKKVNTILHTSSGAVYGKQPHNLTHIKEEYNGSPDIYDKTASYGEGKRVSEMLSNLYNNLYGVNSKIARCFAFVGPYLPLDTHFAIGNFINDVLNKKRIIIKGDGSPFRSYLYSSDLIIWLWNILIFGEACRPYNVGSDQDLTIEDLAKMINTISKTEIEIMLPKTNLPTARYVPDITRAKEELNLQVYTDLEKSIRKTIEFYL